MDPSEHMGTLCLFMTDFISEKHQGNAENCTQVNLAIHIKHT